MKTRIKQSQSISSKPPKKKTKPKHIKRKKGIILHKIRNRKTNQLLHIHRKR